MPQVHPARRGAIRGVFVLLAALIALLVLALPALAQTGDTPPQDVGPEKCALCHQAEAQEWQTSPHAQAAESIDHDALVKQCNVNTGEDCTCLSCHTTSFDPGTKTFSQAGVTCEACHGSYVEGHPENGVMQLDVDSSVCSNCHTETHKAWEQTPHAQAGVQCIGCHRSHSQDLRLEDEALCTSCHRDQLQDAGHVAHARSGINCVDCHAKPPAAKIDAKAANQPTASSTHQFSVDTQVCTGCHQEMFQEQTELAMTQPAAGQPAVSPMSAEAAAACEAEAKASQRWLQGATALSFGLGLGIGGMIGIVFMLILGFIFQRQRSIGQ